MSSIRDKTGTLTYKQQLTNIGKALGFIKKKPVVKDSKGRVIDTSPKTTPKLNIKTRTVYKKKLKPQKSASPKGIGFLPFFTTEK